MGLGTATGRAERARAFGGPGPGLKQSGAGRAQIFGPVAVLSDGRGLKSRAEGQSSRFP